MIVFDTDVVSELQKPKPDPLVEAWSLRIATADSFICGPVIMEQADGAEAHLLRTGSYRFLASLEKLKSMFADRILLLDAQGFELAGRIVARRARLGRPLAHGDAMIAAICLSHGATLATRNVRDFDGLDLKLVNPFEAAT